MEIRKIIKKPDELVIRMTVIIVAIISAIAVSMFALEVYANWRSTHAWQFPIEWVGFIRERGELVIISPIAEETETETETEVTVEEPNIWYGTASFYSHEGCVGCSSNQIMANGDPFIENAITVAFNKLPLNSYVKVTNLDNDTEIVARVTDTGGFESLGRIIDLSKGTKEALGCSDLCTVKVEEVR